MPPYIITLFLNLFPVLKRACIPLKEEFSIDSFWINGRVNFGLDICLLSQGHPELTSDNLDC